MSSLLTPIFEGSQFDLLFGESILKEYFTMEGIFPVVTQGELAAASSLVGGLTPIFNPHPSIRGLYCSGYSGQPFPEREGSTAKTSNRICVHYGRPSAEHPLGATWMELRGANGEIILNRWPYDINGTGVLGEPIFVAYNSALLGQQAGSFVDQIPPNTVVTALKANSDTQFDTAEFPTPNPNWVMTLIRKETQTSILANAQYRRGINTTEWMGFPPYTAVCHDIVDRPVFGCGIIQDHFVSAYEFEIAPDPLYWFRVELFRDWQTGRPAVGIDILDGTNNGYTWLLPWAPVDFNELHFPNLLFTRPPFSTLQLPP